MPSKIHMAPQKYYHIFNRGNNRQLLFKEHDNYRYFLQLAKRHVGSSVDFFAFVLLPDHFHFLIRVKPQEELEKLGITDAPKLSRKFANWFSTYAKAFNKRYNQVSSVFEDRFERIEVDSDNYLSYLVYYIHSNPEKHQLIDNYKDWEHSSYSTFQTTNQSKLILKDEVIDWFGSIDEFNEFHNTAHAQWTYLERQP
ncbi:MAG: transposase [Bacteroidota bacterium]